MRLSDFFYLQKSDRRVLLVLFAMAVVALLAMELASEMPQPGRESAAADSPATAVADTTVSRVQQQAYYAVGEPRPERFAFDPNTADSTQLLRLGLLPWQVRNIYRYRARGGIYRTREDFAQVYGLTAKQYKELAPYITISADYRPAAELVGRPRQLTDSGARPLTAKGDSARRLLGYPVKLKAGETIDLATADTNELRRVPGIGSYFARRIVGYGERLGGYVSTQQLQEIDDFPVEALPYFTIGQAAVRKLNVNKLSLNELKRHPYISFYQARAITDYRRQKGKITDIGQLHLIPAFTPDAIERLRPYITY